MLRAGDSRGARVRAIATAGLLAAVVLLCCAGAQQAQAVTLASPADGAHVDSTPALAWHLARGDEANVVEFARSPARADDGSFSDITDKRIAILDDAQTSYTVPASEPLLAGTWYWHVEADNFDIEPCCSSWSDTRKLVVADARIRITSFAASYLRRIDSLAARFAYSDNSASLSARYRLEFRKRRRGRRVAAIAGKVDRRRLVNGQAFVSRKRPRRLRRGKRYFVRLVLRDAGGHAARTRFFRIKLRR